MVKGETRDVLSASRPTPTGHGSSDAWDLSHFGGPFTSRERIGAAQSWGRKRPGIRLVQIWRWRWRWRWVLMHQGSSTVHLTRTRCSWMRLAPLIPGKAQGIMQSKRSEADLWETTRCPGRVANQRGHFLREASSQDPRKPDTRQDVDRATGGPNDPSSWRNSIGA